MAHCENPTYVVRSYVGDFNFQCFGLPMGSVKPLQVPEWINTIAFNYSPQQHAVSKIHKKSSFLKTIRL